ncbi:hypothetical protein N431DRAFT_517992 [Stipitochalara longipes BDJ]|nr:hypothetical protein N431DRAFT_517992 [Stipitochalara longipes BDJ]
MQWCIRDYEWRSGLFWTPDYWPANAGGQPEEGRGARLAVSTCSLFSGDRARCQTQTLLLPSRLPCPCRRRLKSPGAQQPKPRSPEAHPVPRRSMQNRLQQETPPLSLLPPRPPCLSSHLPGPTPSLRVPNQAFDSFHLPSLTRISTTGATHILASRTHSTADSTSTCAAVEATTFGI